MTKIKCLKDGKIESAKITQLARFSEDFQYIIDSDGNKVKFNDSRIVHIDPAPRNPYGKHLVIDLYKKFNRNIRISNETDKNTLQYAKTICSGRECLPNVAIAGAVLKDIHEYRDKNEITLYRDPLNQFGPCQNGAWPVLWDSFAKRLNLKNVIFCVSPKSSNNFLGLSQELLVWEIINYIIGHYLIEARNALQCIAEGKDKALRIFEEKTNIFINAVKEGKKTLRTGLINWAREIAKIPKKAKMTEKPKVLIFGGLNLLFIHYPVENFFLEKGIIVKVVDIRETINWLISEKVTRFGFKRGKITPKDQFNINLQNLSTLDENEILDAKKAKTSKQMMNFLNSQCNIFRKIISKSGLLFDKEISYWKQIEEGHKYASNNGFTETSLIIGRFLHSAKSGIYDGLINLGTFNCQPAMNSQAIIRHLANRYKIPYAAIDCEGPWITTNQIRLLETIAVQIKRIREEKNKNRIDNI
ncbi:MAG: hypothetical protein ACFFCE_11265 [Promethearchaeota archaeon]